VVALTSRTEVNPNADVGELKQALRVIRRVVQRTEPGRLSGAQAMAMASCFGEIERASASGMARVSPRIIETGAFATDGHASAPDWLSALTGTSAGAAKGRLAAAERAAEVPELRKALKDGLLSAPELNVVATAGAADPAAIPTLLELVEERASHQELCASADAAKAAARRREDERARRARVHAGRHLRWRQCEGGGIRGEFLCDEVQWARVWPRIEAEAQARWKAAGAEQGEPFEAHRLDAFIDLLSHSGTKDVGARPHCLVVVDAEALRRGSTRTGEICEIDGIGPVPVEAAVELLGEGSLQFVIKEGTDIKTVTTSSRDLAQKTAMALIVRDRVCVVPGCGKRLGLQVDHCTIDYKDGGPTTYENLARLCPSHHAMKTYGKWSLSGRPGKWKWTPPSKPPSAGAISRARRVATAKAARNNPRQT
jgi:hypothetical protein